ncbi:hypothetical protein, partial [Escherichia coli]|uniref:hypothetical protein n=1 Tax=Escherichia coli TaxID=562 RepID=UPI00204217F8
LEPEGGSARALIKRGTTTVGRMNIGLNPLPPGSGSWTTRLLAAPLSGGIRYNGPSAVLFSFAGLPDQQLSGPIGVAADFSGRVQAPQLTGIVRASNLTYTNETYGTRLTNMRLDGRFTNDRLELTNMTARAGQGTVQAQGRVGLGSRSTSSPSSTMRNSPKAMRWAQMRPARSRWSTTAKARGWWAIW